MRRTIHAPPSPDLQRVFERSLRTCIVVVPDHPLAGSESVRLSDCAGYNMTLPDQSVSVKPDFDQMFARAKLQIEPVLTSNYYEMLRSVSVSVSVSVSASASASASACRVVVSSRDAALRVVLANLAMVIMPVEATRHRPGVEGLLSSRSRGAGRDGASWPVAGRTVCSTRRRACCW